MRPMTLLGRSRGPRSCNLSNGRYLWNGPSWCGPDNKEIFSSGFHQCSIAAIVCSLEDDKLRSMYEVFRRGALRKIEENQILTSRKHEVNVPRAILPSYAIQPTRNGIGSDRGAVELGGTVPRTTGLCLYSADMCQNGLCHDPGRIEHASQLYRTLIANR